MVKLGKCLWSIGILHLKLIYAAWLNVLSLCQIGAASSCLQSTYAFTCTVSQRRRSLFSKAALVPSSAEGFMILMMRGWSLLRGLTTHDLKLTCPGLGKLIKGENPTPEHLSPKGFATQLTSVNPWYLRYDITMLQCCYPAGLDVSDTYSILILGCETDRFIGFLQNNISTSHWLPRSSG